MDVDRTVSERNKQLIKEYLQEKVAQGVSKNRQIIIIHNLMRIARLTGKDLDKLERKDVTEILTKMERSSFSEWTKATTKNVMKNFYRCLYGLGKNDTLPDIVRNVEIRQPRNKLTKKDLLTPEEVQKMIEVTPNLMTKAMISLLYESGMRPGELLCLRINSVEFGRHCVMINVSEGKMDRKSLPRKIPIFESYDLLRTWINQHPLRNNPDSLLWIKLQQNPNKPFTYRYFCHLVTVLAAKAGIKKRVYPYLFRHSRATYLFKSIRESLAKQQLGHSPNSRMAQVYCHLNEEDLKEAHEKLRGMKIEAKPIQEDGQTCKACNHVNSMSATFCSVCRCALKMETAIQVQNDLEGLVKKMFEEWVKKEKSLNNS